MSDNKSYVQEGGGGGGGEWACAGEGKGGGGEGGGDWKRFITRSTTTMTTSIQVRGPSATDNVLGAEACAR